MYFQTEGVYTTGTDCFAECNKHSAKSRKHSAKEDSVNCTSATTSSPSALCRTFDKILRNAIWCSVKKNRRDGDKWQWQKLYQVYSSTLGKDRALESSSGRPRQPLCRETQTSTRQRELLAECLCVNYRWLLTALCRASCFAESLTLDKSSFAERRFYAECFALGKAGLCRVSVFAESSTRQSLFCQVFDKLSSTKNWALRKVPDSDSDTALTCINFFRNVALNILFPKQSQTKYFNYKVWDLLVHCNFSIESVFVRCCLFKKKKYQKLNFLK